MSLLSSLAKFFIAIVPLCLLSASSCHAEKEENNTSHPYWVYLNDSEDNLDKDKCIFTKFGKGGLRVHLADGQQPFNLNDFYSKSESESEKNIIQIDKKVQYWVLTPNFYGSVTKEKFPGTISSGMKYKYYNDEEGGMPLQFLEECLAIDPIDHKKSILIIGTGIEGKLGVSKPLEKALEDKKQKGEIQGYTIRKSTAAVIAHNRYVKEGKKVFTFIHTAG